jgi:antitoxin (DNA-binding transcriptional repressor) of toxin-antitoxin stability system
MNALVSVREFNANISATLARVESGETLKITRNGKVIAELRPPGADWKDDPEKQARAERLFEILDKGIPGLQGPATYDERTGRGH